MEKERRWGAISGARAGAAVVLALGFFLAVSAFRRAAAEHPDVPSYLHALDAALLCSIYFVIVWGIPFAVWKLISWLLCRLKVSKHARGRVCLFLVIGWGAALSASQRHSDSEQAHRIALAAATWAITFLFLSTVYAVWKGIRWLFSRGAS